MQEQGDPRLISEVSALLSSAEAAHGRFEAEELGGKRDEEWPKWYASYLLDHGLLDLFPDPGASAELGEHLDDLLTEADRLQRANAPGEKWQDYYARFLVDRA
jgi:hypothetical protein